jgi:uncharacterized membrane protein
MLKSNRSLDISKEEKVQGYISEFSNGVFAFAITLLVLDIKLPADTTKSNLGSVLISIWPNYLGFLISFFVIGLFWSSYIRFLKEIIRTDHRLILLNLLYLLFIVLVPFSTSLISLYLSRLSIIVYAGLMAIAGYMGTILRTYAGYKHRLIDKKYSSKSIRNGILLSLSLPIWFTISIGVAFFNTIVAQISWAVVVIAYSIMWHRLRDQLFA